MAKSTKLTTLDKASVNAIQRDIEAALRAVNEKYGVQITMAGGKFDATSADLKLKLHLTAPAPAAVDNSIAKRSFELYAPLHKISANAFGQTIESRGKTLKIIGFSPRRSANPIDFLEVATGKTYRGPASMVSRQYPL